MAAWHIGHLALPLVPAMTAILGYFTVITLTLLAPFGPLLIVSRKFAALAGVDPFPLIALFGCAVPDIGLIGDPLAMLAPLEHGPQPIHQQMGILVTIVQVGPLTQTLLRQALQPARHVPRDNIVRPAHPAAYLVLRDHIVRLVHPLASRVPPDHGARLGFVLTVLLALGPLPFKPPLFHSA